MSTILSIKEQIIKIVNQIPFGKVMYFGQVGSQIVNKNYNFHEQPYKGVSGQVVGFILSGMPSSQWYLLPWHRVVAKNGFISSLKLGAKGLIQKQLLLDEGVIITDNNVDMQKHLFVQSAGEIHAAEILLKEHLKQP